MQNHTFQAVPVNSDLGIVRGIVRHPVYGVWFAHGRGLTQYLRLVLQTKKIPPFSNLTICRK